MNEIPNRTVIHFQPTFGKFGDQPAQSEVPALILSKTQIRYLPEIGFGL